MIRREWFPNPHHRRLRWAKSALIRPGRCFGCRYGEHSFFMKKLHQNIFKKKINFDWLSCWQQSSGSKWLTCGDIFWSVVFSRSQKLDFKYYLSLWFPIVMLKRSWMYFVDSTRQNCVVCVLLCVQWDLQNCVVWTSSGCGSAGSTLGILTVFIFILEQQLVLYTCILVIYNFKNWLPPIYGLWSSKLLLLLTNLRSRSGKIRQVTPNGCHTQSNAIQSSKMRIYNKP